MALEILKRKRSPRRFKKWKKQVCDVCNEESVCMSTRSAYACPECIAEVQRLSRSLYVNEYVEMLGYVK